MPSCPNGIWLLGPQTEFPNPKHLPRMSADAKQDTWLLHLHQNRLGSKCITAQQRWGGGKDRASCQSGGAPALRPGAIAQSPGREAALCYPLLLLPPTLPSIRVFSNESALHIRWPKYWQQCHPIGGSSPGPAVPGILQARTLEWVAISFSNA